MNVVSTIITGDVRLTAIFCVSIISEMCPKPSETRNVSRQSHVEDLEGIPGLFKALTEEDDEDADKWTTITFPVDFQTVVPKGDKTYKFVLREFLINEQHFSRFKMLIIFTQSTESNDMSDTSIKREDIVTFNCTVVYMTQCLSSNKCKQNCESMGATSYR